MGINNVTTKGFVNTNTTIVRSLLTIKIHNYILLIALIKELTLLSTNKLRTLRRKSKFLLPVAQGNHQLATQLAILHPSAARCTLAQYHTCVFKTNEPSQGGDSK